MILYRDEHLVALDKPSGMLVHRGPARDRVVAMTVARDLVGRYVYPVHRLDRGASGVLLLALTREAARDLQRQFAQGRVEKRYLALVRGTPPDAGIIDHPVDGRPSVTEFRRLHTFVVAEADRSFSIVEASPRTGRRHQIRRHLKHVSHPLIGDVDYGKGDLNRLFRERFGLHRLALHAASLSFAHPCGGRPVRIEAPLPADLLAVFAAAGFPGCLPMLQ